jgi:hypothetical protein
VLCTRRRPQSPSLELGRYRGKQLRGVCNRERTQICLEETLLPAHFQAERLYREDWICALARDYRFGDPLSLKEYLSASHIVVSTYPGMQTIPDKQLAAVGVKRASCIRVPYVGVALQNFPATELVLTLTTGITSVVKEDRKLRVVKAPQELHAFHFLMA